ncbi:la-related protein 1C [Macadamia integrifolia]|uniref:la-related protein 1C n=1 Tax=Macadamia integrifolia TaxID=60698 RepID=UPI001C4FCB53|nr:la-related protein 1C [Macadamia integrifolia]
MATTADSASASSNHSPRSSGLSAEGQNSPQQFRRRNLSSPWAHVVRGESEAIPAAPSPRSPPAAATPEQTPDCSSAKSSPENSELEIQTDNSVNNKSNAAKSKKPAWNKPSNGIVEVGPVMGAVSWPALSESTRASPKSSSDSLKALSDGSANISQGPVIASSPQKQPTNNTNPISAPNHAFPVRQKSMKRGGGGGGPANGGLTQPPPPPPPQPVEMPQNDSGRLATVIPDSSPREPPHKSSSNWETGPRGGGFGSQPDHPQQRSSFRRGNGGPHPRGDGSYHNNNNNFGGRRDQDRGNYEWNPPRSFNGRDVHMQQQGVVPRPAFIRPPPPSSAPFVSPPPVRQFGNPMGFPDMTSPVYYVPAPHPDSLRGVPFIAHVPPPAIFFPAPDPQLRAVLVKQIDYYFSSENLCKDIFLRQNMDEQGWVPVPLIAGFNRVKQLTNNISFILDAVRSSTIVEVQGDKIRKRNDWMSWPLPPSSQFTTTSGPTSTAGYDMLATRIQSVGLEEGKTGNHYGTRSPAEAQKESVLSRSSSGDLNSQLTMSGGEGTGQAMVQVGSDRLSVVRSSGKGESC